MDLLAVAIWSFCVALAGGVAGLVLDNLRLPLVLQFSSSAAAGAGANVAISAASALTASIAHWRGGRIDWRLFWLMAPPSLLGGIAGGVDWDLLAAGCAGAVPGAYLGAHLTGRLDDEALLQTIAVILVVAGLSLAAQAILA